MKIQAVKAAPAAPPVKTKLIAEEEEEAVSICFLRLLRFILLQLSHSCLPLISIKRKLRPLEKAREGTSFFFIQTLNPKP